MRADRSLDRLMSALSAQKVILRSAGDRLFIEGTADPALLLKAHRYRRALLARVRNAS